MAQKYKEFFEALQEYTEEITVRDHLENPVLLNLNGKNISVYFGNLGKLSKEKNTVKHSLELKYINAQRQHHKNGLKIAFIGLYKKENNYCAWDPQHIFTSKTKTGKTMRARTLNSKEKLNSPFLDRRKNYTSIIMPASALGTYLDNIEAFHSMTDGSAVIEALTYGMNYSSGDLPGYDYKGSGKKIQSIVGIRSTKSRDEKFQKDVMHAYGNKCCICGFQLVVEAAHIVPHEDDRTSQTVENGLALCPNHHEMYDRHHFKVTSKYRISINHEKVNELRSEGRVGALDCIMKLKGKKICLPNDREAWPSIECLRLRDELKSDG